MERTTRLTKKDAILHIPTIIITIGHSFCSRLHGLLRGCQPFLEVLERGIDLSAQQPLPLGKFRAKSDSGEGLGPWAFRV